MKTCQCEQWDVAENLGEAGERGWRAFLPCLVAPACFCSEMGDVEVPNPETVEAKRTAKWPPQGQAIEHERGPDRLPRGAVLYERDPNDLSRSWTS